jgi:Tfp pilus assembly protein FimT
MKIKTNKGSSFTEILVIIAISVLIVGGVTASFSVFNKSQNIKGAVSEISSELDEARALTLASYDNTVYGVHIESDKVTLFKGDTYSSVSADNEVTELSPRVSISGISLSGGGDDVIFQRLTGKTDQYGTLTVSLISDITETKVITIQESGIIESDI